MATFGLHVAPPVMTWTSNLFYRQVFYAPRGAQQSPSSWSLLSVDRRTAASKNRGWDERPIRGTTRSPGWFGRLRGPGGDGSSRPSLFY
jgi:hypothetical protein